MTVDLHAAAAFLSTHGRVLDRRRLHLSLGETEPEDVLAALDAYRNPDGRYGWGLEPDLRSRGSQPVAAMHALEVLVEAVPATTARAVELCDWLQQHTLGDGGLPFALPVGDSTGCAPFWVAADPRVSSLQMTAQVAAHAHYLGRHQPDVADHPWLAAATGYCLNAIRSADHTEKCWTPNAYELRFALQFLDAVAEREPAARALLEQLGRHVPRDGSMHVEGGAPEEMLHALDFAPHPDRPVRELFADDVIAADLDRLARRQQVDGGWPVDFTSYSPAAALEWRGYVTVHAVDILRRNRH